MHVPAFCERKETISVVFLNEMKLLYRKFSEEAQYCGTELIHEGQAFIHFSPFSSLDRSSQAASWVWNSYRQIILALGT